MYNTGRLRLILFLSLLFLVFTFTVAATALIYSLVWTTNYAEPTSAQDFTVTDTLVVNDVQCIGGGLPLDCFPALAGDATGNLMGVVVRAVQQFPVAAIAPVAGQLMGSNGTAWLPANITSTPGSNMMVTHVDETLYVATTHGVVFETLAVTGDVLLGSNTSCMQPLLPSCYDISAQTCSRPLDGSCLPPDATFNNLMVHNFTLVNMTQLDVPIGNQTALYVDELFVNNEYINGTLTCTGGGSVENGCLNLGNYSCPLGSPLADSCIPASLVQYDQTVTHELTVNLVTCTGPPLPDACLPGLGGDVTGTLATMTVVKLQSQKLSPNVPSDGQVMVWDTAIPGWRPQGNPIYYGDGTQANSAVNTVTLGAGASTLGAPNSVAVGAGATANGVASSVALGPSASPVDALHALALAINNASVVPGTLGLTVNAAPFIVPMWSSLYATTGGAGPTTLTATSASQQYFTTAQTVKLPDVTTLQLGFFFKIVNAAGSGNVVVQSSGGNTVVTITPGSWAETVCVLTSGTTAASWNARSGGAASLAGDDVGPLASNVVTALQGHALASTLPTDGQVMAWDTIAPGWRPQGNPVYYGDGTQANSGTSTTVIGPSASAIALDAVALGNGAIANGNSSIAIGNAATAATVGYASTSVGAIAIGDSSVARCVGCIALGQLASNNATGSYSVAMGYSSFAGSGDDVAIGKFATTGSVGTASVALGSGSTATSAFAVAIGYQALATTNANAAAFGKFAAASGASATAVGTNTVASSTSAAAFGDRASATGTNAVAMGLFSSASNTNAVALGPSTVASASAATALGRTASASGISSTAVGVSTIANATSASAWGDRATASGFQSIASGVFSAASGQNAIALGTSSVASGTTATALGPTASSSNTNSLAAGSAASASGISSTAVGRSATATATSASAWGDRATCTGFQSIASGVFSTTNGTNSVALGTSAAANADTATALGPTASASATNALAVGSSAVASGISSTAFGQSASASATDALCVGHSCVSNTRSVVLGVSATSNSIVDAIVIGNTASAPDTAHALALSLNAASVTPGALGISLNANSRVIRTFGSMYASTAGAGPTVLTVSSAFIQVFTTAQTVTLPVASTLELGFLFKIVNRSGGNVVVQSSGGNTVITLATFTAAELFCILASGTTAASWSALGPVTAS